MDDLTFEMRPGIVTGFLGPHGAGKSTTLRAVMGLVAVVYAVTEAPGRGFDDPGVLAALVGGLGLLAAFVAWQLRCDHPILEVRLFASRRFSVSSLAVTLASFAMVGVLFSMSQLLQLVLGFGALTSALAMIPMMAPMMLMGPLVPNVVRLIGSRATVTAGLATVAGGFWILGRLGVATSYATVLVGMCVMAIGMALVTTPATDMMMSAVPKDRSGMGSAMNDTTRELGGTLGVAVLGSLIASVYARDLAPALVGRSADVAATASTSLASALKAAGSTGAADLAQAAREAWLGGLTTATTVGAMVCVVAAALTAVLLPRSERRGAQPA